MSGDVGFERVEQTACTAKNITGTSVIITVKPVTESLSNHYRLFTIHMSAIAPSLHVDKGAIDVGVYGHVALPLSMNVSELNATTSTRSDGCA